MLPAQRDGWRVCPCIIAHPGRRCVYAHTWEGWVCTVALRLCRPPVPYGQDSPANARRLARRAAAS